MFNERCMYKKIVVANKEKKEEAENIIIVCV